LNSDLVSVMWADLGVRNLMDTSPSGTVLFFFFMLKPPPQGLSRRPDIARLLLFGRSRWTAARVSGITGNPAARSQRFLAFSLLRRADAAGLPMCWYGSFVGSAFSPFRAHYVGDMDGIGILEAQVSGGGDQERAGRPRPFGAAGRSLLRSTLALGSERSRGRGNAEIEGACCGAISEHFDFVRTSGSGHAIEGHQFLGTYAPASGVSRASRPRWCAHR